MHQPTPTHRKQLARLFDQTVLELQSAQAQLDQSLLHHQAALSLLEQIEALEDQPAQPTQPSRRKKRK